MGQLPGMWSMPAYWNGNLYFWAGDEVTGAPANLVAYSFVNGILSANPTSTSVENSVFPGSTPTVSANGTTNGIVWDIRSDAYALQGRDILYAHSATNVATTLYSSEQNVVRDNPGNAVKFTVPTVINGKVYVGAEYQVSIFGLLGAKLGWVEGVELNLLTLVAGLDVRHPALKLPGFGRVGLDALTPTATARGR